MFHRAAMSRSASMVLTLSCFVAAGCAGVRHAQTTEPVPVAPPSAPVAVVEEAPVPAVPQVEVAPAVAEVPVLPAPPPAVQPVRPVEPAPAARVAVPKVPAQGCTGHDGRVTQAATEAGSCRYGGDRAPTAGDAKGCCGSCRTAGCPPRRWTSRRSRRACAKPGPSACSPRFR